MLTANGILNMKTKKAFNSYTTNADGQKIALQKSTHVEIRFYDAIQKGKQDFISFCMTNWELTSEQAEKLCEANMTPGWTRLSEKIIDELLPGLDQPSDPDNPKNNDFATLLDAVNPLQAISIIWINCPATLWRCLMPATQL